MDIKEIRPELLAYYKTYVGKRVRLINCTDPYTKLVHGDEGVVTSVDSFGTVHVDWDNGSRLGLVYREDDFALVEPLPPPSND
jgi:hypothetical protein